MTYDSVWPLLVILGVMIIGLSIPIFNNIISIKDNQEQRVNTIDGLRGYLAFFIVFFHATVWYNLVTVHEFKAASGSACEALGTTGLCIFFMVSAYLFWTRWLNHHGKINIPAFYIKRFFRIAPVYYLCFVVVVIVAMSKTNWHLAVPVYAFIQQIMGWLFFGLFTFPTINGYSLTLLLLLGVVWTIPYEWMLYLALPIIGVFTKNLRWSLVFAVALCTLTVFAQFYWKIHFFAENDMVPFIAYAVGILIATLKKLSWQPFINNFYGSIVMVLCILGVVIFYRQYPELLMLVFAGIFFYCVVSGCSLFGLLTLKASQRMGMVSYSIYLCQGIIFYFVYSFNFVKQLVMRSIWHYWGVLFCESILLLGLACLLFRLIEKPGMNIGHRLAFRFERKITNKMVER